MPRQADGNISSDRSEDSDGSEDVQDDLVAAYGSDNEAMLQHAILFERPDIEQNISYEDLMVVSNVFFHSTIFSVLKQCRLGFSEAANAA